MTGTKEYRIISTSNGYRVTREARSVTTMRKNITSV